MPYLKLDDGYLDDDRFDDVSYPARWLHVAALTYCARRVTDGHVKKVKLARLSDVDDPTACAQELIDAGFWESTATGYYLPDYLRMNRSREQVEADQAAARGRKQRYYDRLNASRNGVPNAEPNDVPNASLPFPSLPLPKGEGKGEATGQAAGSRCPHGRPSTSYCASCDESNIRSTA